MTDLSLPVSALPDLRLITIRTRSDGRWYALETDKKILASHSTLGGLLVKLASIKITR